MVIMIVIAQGNKNTILNAWLHHWHRQGLEDELFMGLFVWINWIFGWKCIQPYSSIHSSCRSFYRLICRDIFCYELHERLARFSSGYKWVSAFHRGTDLRQKCSLMFSHSIEENCLYVMCILLAYNWKCMHHHSEVGLRSGPYILLTI